jgi:hypothetical protein
MDHSFILQFCIPAAGHHVPVRVFSIAVAYEHSRKHIDLFVFQLTQRHDFVFLPLSADIADPAADRVCAADFKQNFAGFAKVIRPSP